MSYPKPSVEGTPFASKEWTECVATLRGEGKGDKPIAWDERPRWEMANVHLFFFELFERFYLFADFAVVHDDLVNYLGFTEVVLFATLHFPRMAEAAGVDHWAVNVEEHRQFDENLEAALVYVRFCRQNLHPIPPISPVPAPSSELVAVFDKFPALDATKPFDPKALRAHLDRIISPFGRHMTDELKTLSRDKIALVGEKEYAEIEAKIGAKLRGYGPEWFLCSAFAAMPMDLLRQMLPLPFIVRKVFLPLWWGPKFAAWWKYCPYPENLTLFGSRG